MEVLVIRTLDAFKSRGLARVLLTCVQVASSNIECKLAFVHVHTNKNKGGFGYFTKEIIGYKNELSKLGNIIKKKESHAGGTYSGFRDCRT